MKNLVRNFFLTGTLLYASCANSQTHQLVKIWETDSTLKVPESVLFYAPGKVLFVSNINGGPGEKDSKGSIAKVSLDGKNVNLDWAVNLSAPKGMGIFKQSLFVADIDELVKIDLNSGKVTQRIAVPGAGFLNDVSIDQTGVIYVSDSKTGKIHRIEKGNVSTYLENQSGINGLLAVADELYLLAKGNLWKADKNKKLQKIAGGMDESTDGIEQTSNNNFVVSCWNGVVYYVKADGNVEQLLDTRAQKINAADIGFDSKNNMVYVPTFLGNKVVAYQLK